MVIAPDENPEIPPEINSICPVSSLIVKDPEFEISKPLVRKMEEEELGDPVRECWLASMTRSSSDLNSSTPEISSVNVNSV